MNFVVWIVVGGLVGAIGTLVTRAPQGSQGLFVNVVVGLIGALIGGWLISPLIGAGALDNGELNIRSLAGSITGAVSLVAIVHLSRRRRAHRSVK